MTATTATRIPVPTASGVGAIPAPARPASANPTPADPTVELSLHHDEGWQALAVASLGRPLNDAELAAVECLPVEIALDLLFPDLGDAARHEAMWALG